MTPARAGLRSATAAGLAALAVAVFGFPEAFLAVLASQLLVSQARGGGRFLGCNLWAVGIGAFSGVGALALCAQEPWLLLPVGGIVAGIGGACWWGSRGPVAAMVFLMGLVAPLGSGLIYPEGSVTNGLAHAGSLILALLAAALARTLFGGDADEQTAIEGTVAPFVAVPAANFGLLSGLAVMTGFGVAALLLPERTFVHFGRGDLLRPRDCLGRSGRPAKNRGVDPWRGHCHGVCCGDRGVGQ